MSITILWKVRLQSGQPCHSCTRASLPEKSVTAVHVPSFLRNLSSVHSCSRNCPARLLLLHQSHHRELLVNPAQYGVRRRSRLFTPIKIRTHTQQRQASFYRFLLFFLRADVPPRFCFCSSARI
mmetsp:Transcript_57605/g.128540  ORF Transcript_57605/g.128540 Transcript_57605/m.128540 type:complete len:124 (+) Transcript_57605:244-615(+)